MNNIVFFMHSVKSRSIFLWKIIGFSTKWGEIDEQYCVFQAFSKSLSIFLWKIIGFSTKWGEIDEQYCVFQPFSKSRSFFLWKIIGFSTKWGEIDEQYCVFPAFSKSRSIFLWKIIGFSTKWGEIDEQYCVFQALAVTHVFCPCLQPAFLRSGLSQCRLTSVVWNVMASQPLGSGSRATQEWKESPESILIVSCWKIMWFWAARALHWGAFQWFWTILSLSDVVFCSRTRARYTDFGRKIICYSGYRPVVV